MSLSVSYSWAVDVAPDDLAEWVVYAATEREAKGQEVARVPGGDRYATWTSDETLIYVRVLAVKRGGVEEPWDAVEPDEVLVQGRDVAKEPDAPASVSVGMVDLGQSGRVEVEPPTRGDPPAFVQVIQGADADTGKLLAEHKVLPSGPIGTDGAPRQLSMPIPMEGSGGTKSIVVRNMGTAGRPSSDVVRTVQEQDDLPQFHEVAVCSWNGTTRSNIPAAATTDAHEFDATDGARARAKPTLAGATAAAGWGTLSSGLLASGEFHGAYLRTVTVESDEVDLGAALTFRLTAADAVGRKAAAGTSRPLYATKVPLVPAARQDVRLLPEGPAWAARETRLNGKPRQPIRSWRWEYVVGTSSPVSHASSDYKPLTPGLLLNGRYVRVRLVVTDPTGQHRIVCPSASVKAHVFRRTVVGSGSPESSVAAPPGSHYHRTDGPPHHYVKVTGVGNTGWVATNAGAGASLSDGDYGDITVSSSGTAMAIDAGAVTNAKMANMATARIKGRTTAGAGDPEDLTAAQATAILDAVVGDSGSGGTKGLAPAPSAGDAAANKYLHADGTYKAAAGRLLNRYIYTSGSGATHTPNAACTKCLIKAWAPGGGGGGGDTSGSNSGAGAGGGSGGYVEKLWATNGNITYTVPAGGAGGTAGNNAGTAGSDLTVTGTGLSLTAKGGTGGGSMAGGTGVASSATGGNTSGTTGGDLNQEGQGGQRGSRFSAAGAFGGNGAASGLGDGGSGGGAGGDAGADAASYGAGGGGGSANAGSGDKAGGQGGGGLLIIEEYA